MRTIRPPIVTTAPDEAGVAADLRVPLPQVRPLGRPVHHGEHGQLRAVADLGDDGAADVDRDASCTRTTVALA